MTSAVTKCVPVHPIWMTYEYCQLTVVCTSWLVDDVDVRERLAMVAGPRPRPGFMMAGRVAAHQRSRPATSPATARADVLRLVKLRGEKKTRVKGDSRVEYCCV